MIKQQTLTALRDELREVVSHLHDIVGDLDRESAAIEQPASEEPAPVLLVWSRTGTKTHAHHPDHPGVPFPLCARDRDEDVSDWEFGPPEFEDPVDCGNCLHIRAYAS